MLDSLDLSGAPERASFPGLSFDAYDVLTSSDMDSECEDLMAERQAFDADSEDEDLMAERKAFRAMLRSNRDGSSHCPPDLVFVTDPHPMSEPPLVLAEPHD